MPVKKRLKNLLARVFVAGGGCERLRRRQAGRLVVIYYHRLVPEGGMIDANLPGMYVSEGAFAEQLRLLQERYHPMSEEALLAACRGDTPWPRYPVVVTFDDGYQDNLTLAAPILKRYQVPWLLFATTGFIDNEVTPWFDTLFLLCRGRDELRFQGEVIACEGLTTGRGCAAHRRLFRQLAALPGPARERWLMAVLAENGVDRQALSAGLFGTWDGLAALGPSVGIGGHTRSHPFLSHLTPEQATAEIVPARDRLSSRLGRRIETFAYPTGRREDFNAETIAILERHHFTCAFTTCYGINDLSPGPDRYRLHRIGIDYFDTIQTFHMKITGGWRWFAANRP